MASYVLLIDFTEKGLQAIGDSPERAEALVGQLRERVNRVREGLSPADPTAKVFCIDWLTPLRNKTPWWGFLTPAITRQRLGPSQWSVAACAASPT